MRYNKQELVALASQTSQKFDREGVLVLKERQDGFFRRSEGCSVRWFRLRGNLLFYLKGPEPWYEPMGVIVLGHHEVRTQSQDDNGHWPFQIMWENGVCYKMATFHESERDLWLKAMERASHDKVTMHAMELRTRLNKIRPDIDISNYRLQKGIVTDMNEVPLCEVALSCDNLLCDEHGRPPSPRIILYVRYEKGLCVRYASTELVETCSNPCFSRTILFRASDGLTGTTRVRVMVYDVRERVTETAVPIGYTSMLLSTIQEAQRLRVPIWSRDQKAVGFITLNGWSLEPSYIGTSPSHTNDGNSIDIPHKIMGHRRSQSLPPRLGLKLKFPSYGNLLKQNFVNSYQVTYRFHSGLGGDITVHEIMAEPKLCFLMPLQLVDIYIQRENELLEELLSVGEISGEWQSRQIELVKIHTTLLENYCRSRRSMIQMKNQYFKASSRKEEPSLQFAPINLHLQRMWVHNDTLNKTGFHDVITVGAFAAHMHTERTGGLIRLVQLVKDINSTKAELSSITNKIQAEYDNLIAVRQLRNEISQDMEKIVLMIQAKQFKEIDNIVEGIKTKVKSILAQFEPASIEKSLSYMGWPKDNCVEPDQQTLATILRFTEELSVCDTTSDCDTVASSSTSSKETSPIDETPTFSSSVPNIPNCRKKLLETELHFDNDYFKLDIDNIERGGLNSSFRSVRLTRPQCVSFDFTKRHGSLRHDFKSSASLEQVSYRSLVDGLKKDKNKGFESTLESTNLPYTVQVDEITRQNNLTFLQNVGTTVEGSLTTLVDELNKIKENNESTEENLDSIKTLMEGVRFTTDDIAKWMRVSHASIRLRCESPQWAHENGVLQTRRDTCFSQALTTVTAGLLCWLSSMPGDIIVKVLSSGLGPLCGFEGLLTLSSTEKAMWGDMVVAVEDLQTVVFTLTKVGHSNSLLPQVSGTRGALTVNIPVSVSLYTKFTSKAHLSFTVTAVFFNIGINDKATMAEALGETIPQCHSNSDNFDRLYNYYHKFYRLFPADLMAASRASSRSKPLEKVMEIMRITVHKKKPKNVKVLHMAALAVRLMNGIRFTSCKSAKDRTGMSVTLEQANILEAEYHLAEHEFLKVLDIIRSEGCRRENTYKNTGVRKYAFTKKQVVALPTDYKPPPGTYGSTQS